ncbi:MAG TPA: hypothetical protein VIE65_05225 [Methylobacter sp.]|jgi:thiosulfate reductase cytochrome b subunit
MPTREEKHPTDDAMLVEYEAAQASAEHHDTLVWTVTNSLWALSMVLFGFAVSVLDKPAVQSQVGIKVLLSGLCFVGVSLLSYAWFCALQFASIRNQKYRRCKALEKHLGLQQHTNLEHFNHSQRVLYAIVLFFMVIAWVALLVLIWVIR